MEVVKAFNTNSLHTEIIIKGTVWDPLFRASDIGVVLEMANIRQSIMNFDNKEKIVSTRCDLIGQSDQKTVGSHTSITYNT